MPAVETESDKPSTQLMLFNIGGTTLVIAGVVLMFATADLMPGLALCVVGAGLLVVASQRRPKSKKSDDGPQ